MIGLPRSARSAPAGLLWLTLAWLAATGWARPLTLPSEGRYVGVAWEMMASGDWLTPTLNGLPFFHKPPLFYWLTAAAMSLLGTDVWAARIAPLLGAAAGAWALYLFARRWFSPATAELMLVVLLTQPLWFIGGQFANLDMLVAGCITVTIVLLAHAVLCAEQGHPHRLALVGAWAAAGLGVLSKGLIGFVLPGLVMLAWLLATRRWRRITMLLWWPGPLVFLMLAAPWFVSMQLRFPKFLDYFFVLQHVKRFALRGFNNPRPAWFFPAVLAGLGLPWFAWALRLRISMFRRAEPGSDVRVLMACWVLVIVAFFSLPESKIVGYVLPAVPPLSLLLADAAGRSGGRWSKATAVLAAMVCLGLVAGMSLRQQPSNREVAQALRAHAEPGDTVLFVREYFFDIRFHARWRPPVQVLDLWDSPEVPLGDNWRKELADAGAFAPTAAAATLLTPDRLPEYLCRAGTHWVVTPVGLPSDQQAFLGTAEVVLRGSRATLWRLSPGDPASAAALGCQGAPPAGRVRRRTP